MAELGAPKNLASEIVAKLEALPDPKVPSGVTRSKFMKSCIYWIKWIRGDWRRLVTGA